MSRTSAARSTSAIECTSDNTETEALLLKQLSAEPTHIDEVCRSSELPVATVSGTLAMMELKGLVKQTGTMNYILSRETREAYRVRVD